MDIRSAWMSFLGLPFSGVLITLLAFIIVCMFLSFILRLITRWFFRPLKMAACFVIGTLVISGISAVFFQHPIVSGSQNQVMLDKAKDEFSGIYSKQLPLIAWRIREPKKQETTTLSDSNEVVLLPGVNDSGQSKLQVEVSYLPFGKLLLSYDAQNGSFSIDPSNSNVESGLFADILDSMDGLLPKALTDTDTMEQSTPTPIAQAS